MEYPYISELIAPPSHGANYAFISIYVFLGEETEITERTRYSILDVLQVVGGFTSMIYIASLAFVASFQKQIYKSSILKSLYVLQGNVGTEEGNSKIGNDEREKL